ncbi:MAG: type III PLP-dependent enzyme [Pseudomonadota bacterium]
MANYKDATHVARLEKPSQPVFCLRPEAAARAARWFIDTFPGTSFYAVKANPSPWLLRALNDAGVNAFEVASITEVRLVRSLFSQAEIAFMHPVKAEESIREAYNDHGVRTFSLDSEAELDKILRATGDARDLTLCLRHAVPNDEAKISLGRKFGASGDTAVALLQRMRQVARRLGVAFHVGSQTMSPSAYVNAIDVVEQTIVRAGVIVDILDVGGGFPADYPGMTPPPLSHFVDAIAHRFEEMLVAENCELWCEPGRALCAESSSLIIRIEGRRDDALHVNDGVYGALFDAGHLNWPFPTRALSQSGPAEIAAYSLYGPTCDDLDFMPGPFYLPAGVEIGDYIEVGVLGAYGVSMRTQFNGFGAYAEFVVDDEPMTTVYGDEIEAVKRSEESANG